MPRGHVLGITSVAAFVLCISSCGLTADFSGLQGGQRDAGVDFGVPDAGGDRVDGDGADVDACVPVASYCASLTARPLFCSDFDDCRLPDPWTESSLVGGQLTLESGAFVSRSPPSSLAAQDFAGVAQADSADLHETFSPIAPAPSTLTFAFSIQPVSIDSMTAGPRLVVAAVDLLDGSDAATPNRYTLQFTLVRSGSTLNLALEELSGGGCPAYTPYVLPDVLGQNAWTDVRLTVKRSAPMAGTASVAFGATTELSNAQLCMNVDATLVKIGIGSIYKTPITSAWKNRFDNVTFDLVSGP